MVHTETESLWLKPCNLYFRISVGDSSFKSYEMWDLNLAPSFHVAKVKKETGYVIHKIVLIAQKRKYIETFPGTCL